ncbi:MAG: hypothetical protein U0872_11455 [Planctomycetaceae bacterium]
MNSRADLTLDDFLAIQRDRTMQTIAKQPQIVETKEMVRMAVRV